MRKRERQRGREGERERERERERGRERTEEKRIKSLSDKEYSAFTKITTRQAM